MTAAKVRWRRGIWAVFAAALALSLLLSIANILLWPQLAAPLAMHNPDAWQRLALVKAWMTGGDFYSHAAPSTNAPDGGVTTPWTRPLDFILSGLAFLMPAALLQKKLMLAAALYPVLLALAAAKLMASGARKLFRHNHVLACTALLMIASPYMPDYFKPGDADHHGLMSVLWCGAVVLLLDDVLTKTRAFMTGALCGLITWVSPEGLLPFFAAIAVLGLDAFFAKDGDTRRINAVFFAALGAAVTASLVLPAEIPPDKISGTVTYDSVSIVHVVFFWLAAGAAGFLALLWQFARTKAGRGYLAGAAGLAAGLIMHALYPKFFLGPFAGVDPYITETFLPMVQEAQPLLSGPLALLPRTLMLPALAAVLLGFALLKNKPLRTSRRGKLLKLSALLGMAFILSCFQSRWIYYVSPVAIIAAGGLLPVLAAKARKFAFAPKRWQPYLWITVLFAGTTGAVFIPALFAKADGQNGPTAACLQDMRYVIETQQLQKLLGEKPLALYVLEDLAGEVQFFTAYRVIAGNYHREAAGLKDANALRISRNTAALKKLLDKRKVDALLYCPVYHTKQEVLSSLHKKPPGWFSPVAGLEFPQPDGDKPLLIKVKR